MSTDTIARSKEKTRNISFVADVFERSVQWVRWCEAEGKFRRTDGTYILPRRTRPANAAAGFRKYTLHDIHEMIDSIYRENLVDGETHARLMNKLDAWGYDGNYDAA